MTNTPWGAADDLVRRKLRPGPGLPRDVVAQNQRERLFAALVRSVEERGYQATSVAHVLELAGVSRSTFYEHFASKEECFLAAFEATSKLAIGETAAACRAGDSWEMRFRSACGSLIELITSQPAAARMCFVDVYAAGPQGLAYARQAGERFGRLVQQGMASSPEHEGVPGEIAMSIVRGMRHLIYLQLRDREPAGLAELRPELERWALSYCFPAAGAPEIAARTKRAAPRRRASVTRTRKTAALAFPPLEQATTEELQRARILDAVGTIVAELGYDGLTIGRLAATAAMSRRTFYANFRNKDEAFLAAFDTSAEQLFERTIERFQGTLEWPQALHRSFARLLTLLADKPDLARLGFVEANYSSRRAIEHRDRELERFATALLRDPRSGPYSRDVPSLTPEAIAGGLYGLVADYLVQFDARTLPTLLPAFTTFALTPYLGAAAAYEIAISPPGDD